MFQSGNNLNALLAFRRFVENQFVSHDGKKVAEASRL